jgi:hypothetical protein
MVKLSVSKTELLGSNPSSPASFPTPKKVAERGKQQQEFPQQEGLRQHHGKGDRSGRRAEYRDGAV